MTYSYYSSTLMINKYSPLVNAAIKVKSEATTAHLWLEEIMSGDRYVNIEDVIEHIDQSDWYARAMLEGGQNPKGTFLPLSDLALRKEVAVTIEQLNEFKEITFKRYHSIESAGVGSEIDQLYDELFKNIVAQVDTIETLLQQKISANYNRYSSIQIMLIIVAAILSVLVFFVQYRYDREQKKTILATNEAFERFKIILNSLEAFVYVADMNTYEILFINNYGIKIIGGDIIGKICWQSIQEGQTGPCDFCTNKYLLNEDGRPGDAYKWEFQNTVTGKWFHIADRAITWTDGRIVRLEIATDISDRKEDELIKESLIGKLEKSLKEINTLRGILPICSFCKNIRNDEGYYEQIEGYIHKHSGYDFSHTICPKCAKENYPEQYKKIISKNSK